MDPYIKLTKKFTKKFGSKVINRQYFHRKTGLKTAEDSIYIMRYEPCFCVSKPEPGDNHTVVKIWVIF
jgi:hypothetical protein